VISNWDDRLKPLLRNLDLAIFFELIEVSAESGFHKPAPQIFHRVLAALGLRPSQVLHVGDSLNEDVRGAKGAGLHARWLRRNLARPEAGDLASLTDILALLG
jgi:putative hydrolase of the HAD superfamily